MATNFIQDGDTISVVAPSTTASGDGVQVGLLFGVAITDAGSGDDVQIKTTGIWRLPKVTTETWAVGNQIYWDDGNSRCTTVDNNVPIGVAMGITANPSATGLVRLTGQVVGTAMVGT